MDVCNDLAKELRRAMADAIANDPGVAACHERAAAQGFRMEVSLEALIVFATRSSHPKTRALVKRPVKPVKWELNRNDKRFLRGMRIATDEPVGAPEVE